MFPRGVEMFEWTSVPMVRRRAFWIVLRTGYCVTSHQHIVQHTGSTHIHIVTPAQHAHCDTLTQHTLSDTHAKHTYTAIAHTCLHSQVYLLPWPRVRLSWAWVVTRLLQPSVSHGLRHGLSGRHISLQWQNISVMRTQERVVISPTRTWGSSTTKMATRVRSTFSDQIQIPFSQIKYKYVACPDFNSNTNIFFKYNYIAIFLFKYTYVHFMILLQGYSWKYSSSWKYIIQAIFMITQLVISTHIDVSATVSGVH